MINGNVEISEVFPVYNIIRLFCAPSFIFFLNKHNNHYLDNSNNNQLDEKQANLHQGIMFFSKSESS